MRYEYPKIFQKEEAKPFIRKVNRRIAELRAKKGFTQETLAERMNVEVRTIRRWEAGANISLRVLYGFQIVLEERICDFFREPARAKGVPGRPRR